MPTLTLVRIDVTAADIAAGKFCIATGCPVALALARALPASDMPAVVSCLYVCYGPYDARKTLRLPDHVGDWIAAFDAGLSVVPIAFDVEVEL